MPNRSHLHHRRHKPTTPEPPAGYVAHTVWDDGKTQWDVDVRTARAGTTWDKVR